MIEHEKFVPPYVLPSVLDLGDGRRVGSAFEWMNFRRGEVLRLFERVMYGKIPPRPDAMRYELRSEKHGALNGCAVRREIRVHFAMNTGHCHHMDMLLYSPENASESLPAPVFLGLNFKGNQNTTPEADVIPTGFQPNGDFASPERGCQVQRWDFETVVRRGYASATVCYFDLFPDSPLPEAWEKTIYSMFYPGVSPKRIHERNGAISAWAWGLSRMLDALECMPDIRADAAVVHGHSRLGKTALWAAANDPRFRMVAANCSGYCGAALSRRRFGETIDDLTRVFPHWFVSEFGKFAGRENDLPFDQHWLISLLAPRFAVVSSATEDLWADPKGEFLACVHAAEVYRLFGSESTGTDVMPAPDVCLSGPVAYHLRTGIHDQTPFDWRHFLDLADRCFAGETTGTTVF